MKRKIFAALAIGTIAISSCKKVEPTPPRSPGSATVQGTLFAHLDTWNDTNQFGQYQVNLEYVPVGTKVTVIVNSYFLDQTPDSAYNYQDLKFTTTVGANGAFSIKNIPCFNTPIQVAILFNDFMYNQRWGPLANNYTAVTYSLAASSFWVYDGAIVIRNDIY